MTKRLQVTQINKQEETNHTNSELKSRILEYNSFDFRLPVMIKSLQEEKNNDY